MKIQHLHDSESIFVAEKVVGNGVVDVEDESQTASLEEQKNDVDALKSGHGKENSRDVGNQTQNMAKVHGPDEVQVLDERPVEHLED